MKKIILYIVAIATISINSFGQAPEGFKYQAVVRNAFNTILINQAVGLRMTIKQGSISGTSVYSESFSSTTTTNGLVNVEIGNGTPILGTFANIDWANGPFFIETAIDATGGSNYIVMGTSQLMSVPYALYAKTSGSSTPGPIGPQGPSGVGILSTIDNGNGTFTINYTDGSSFTTSNLTGPIGANGTVGSVNAISATSNANGAIISGNNLTLTPADALNGGIVTTGSQTISGSKTFLSDLNVNGAIFGHGGGSNISNTASGTNALPSNTTGSANTANGLNSLLSNTTGSANVAVGLNAMINNTIGGANTANGLNALSSNTEGNANTAIGQAADVAVGNLSNATAIGAHAVVDASNKIQLGNSSVTNVNTSGTYTGAGFKTPSGTSSQYLMADGSVSSSGPQGQTVVLTPTTPPINGLVFYKTFQNSTITNLYDDGQIRIRLNLGTNKLYLTNVNKNISNIWSNIGTLSSSGSTSMSMNVGNGYFQNFGTTAVAMGTEINVYSNLSTSNNYEMTMYISSPDTPSYGLYVIKIYFNGPISSSNYSNITVNYYRDPTATP